MPVAVTHNPHLQSSLPGSDETLEFPLDSQSRERKVLITIDFAPSNHCCLAAFLSASNIWVWGTGQESNVERLTHGIFMLVWQKMELWTVQVVGYEERRILYCQCGVDFVQNFWE